MKSENSNLFRTRGGRGPGAIYTLIRDPKPCGKTQMARDRNSQTVSPTLCKGDLALPHD